MHIVNTHFLTNNNPLVGKTSVIEGIAQMMVQGDVPGSLKNQRIVSLDFPALIAGAKYQGEFEERFKGVLQEVQADKSVLLFIDEVHMLLGGGTGQATGQVGAANILKPMMQRGEIRCIGCTTLEEYRIMEKDPALARRFQSVLINEPSVADSITILRGLKSKYETHHGVFIHDSALVAACELSDKYLPNRKQPDKSIDLIDEAASRLRLGR